MIVPISVKILLEITILEHFFWFIYWEMFFEHSVISMASKITTQHNPAMTRLSNLKKGRNSSSVCCACIDFIKLWYECIVLFCVPTCQWHERMIEEIPQSFFQKKEFKINFPQVFFTTFRPEMGTHMLYFFFLKFYESHKNGIKIQGHSRIIPESERKCTKISGNFIPGIPEIFAMSLVYEVNK